LASSRTALVQGEGAGDAGRADTRPGSPSLTDLGAPHSPISARSCSETFTRRGWGGKAEQESGSALVHLCRAASRAGRSWGHGAQASPTLPHRRPAAAGAVREAKAADLTQRAPSTHRSTQPPPEQRSGIPLPPRGHRVPGAATAAPGAPSSLPGPSSPACAELPGTGAAAVVQRVATRLTQLLAPMWRNQQQESNVSGKKIIKKTPIPVQETRQPALASQPVPRGDRDPGAGSRPSPAPHRVPVQEDVPDVLPQDPGILGRRLLANVRA